MTSISNYWYAVSRLRVRLFVWLFLVLSIFYVVAFHAESCIDYYFITAWRVNLHNKRRYVCLSVYLFVCLLPMAGRTTRPIKTKLGIGTHVDPGSVLVKVKVMRPARAERIRARSAINTADRGPQGRDNRARSAINLRPEDGYLQLVINK